MYISVAKHLDGAVIEAYRVPSAPSEVWFAFRGGFAAALSESETETLIAALQRELDAMRAEARAAADAKPVEVQS